VIGTILFQSVEFYSFVATIIMALITGMALGYAKTQLEGAHRLQKDAYRQDMWCDYIQRAFENPVMADPSLGRYDYKKRTLNGSKEKFLQYDWFVTILLDVFEAIWRSKPDDIEIWEKVATSHLSLHVEFLSIQLANSPEDYGDYYNKDFWKHVEATVIKPYQKTKKVSAKRKAA
jgi:hypothetical protein